MKKITGKDKIELIKKLKPFWMEYDKIALDYIKKIRSLEKKMNNKLKLKTKLELFYADGEYVGIGAQNYSDRAWFPLIQGREFY